MGQVPSLGHLLPRVSDRYVEGRTEQGVLIVNPELEGGSLDRDLTINSLGIVLPRKTSADNGGQ